MNDAEKIASERVKDSEKLTDNEELDAKMMKINKRIQTLLKLQEKTGKDYSKSLQKEAKKMQELF